MDFMKYVKQGVEIIKLNKKVISKVSKDKNATKMAVLFFALGGVASAIGMFCIPCIIFAPIMVLIFTFLWFGFLHLLAKMFGGKASFAEFYRANGIGSVVTWVSVIPLLGGLLSFLASLWALVMTFTVLRTTHKLSSGRAALVLAIPLVISFVLVIMFAAFIIAMFAAIYGVTGADAGTLQSMFPTN